MLKHPKKYQSLSEVISDILCSTPSFDAVYEQETKPIVTESYSKEDTVQLSKFRKHDIVLLEDARYAGVKSQRQNLKNNEDWTTDEISNGDVSNSEQSKDGTTSSEDDDSNLESLTKRKRKDSTQDNISNDLVDDNLPSSYSKKGTAVRNQLFIWDHLLEMRIQLQNSLILANKMPHGNIFKKLYTQSPEKISETKRNIRHTLGKLLELQLLLLSLHPETKNLLNTTANTNSPDGEEILSDTEEKIKLESKTCIIPTKRRKLSDYEMEISTHHDVYDYYKCSVIRKWDDKTRISVANTSNSVHSILNHIDFVLNDKQKLIRRTQVNRFSVKTKSNSENLPKTNEDINTEIFDDSDFYYKLLKELIETKSRDVTDPSVLGNQWIQLQNLRNKMKRSIDTRATKGRKIRYTTHSKVVNFMAPINNIIHIEDVRSIYNSLFGKN